MIAEEELEDLDPFNPAEALVAAAAFRDAAAQLAAHAREAESAQETFAAHFRSKRMPDTVSQFVAPARAELTGIHSTTTALFGVIESAADAHRELSQRRGLLVERLQLLNAREVPDAIAAWMAEHGAVFQPEVEDVPAARALEEAARDDVTAFNSAVEEFVFAFEGSIRAIELPATTEARNPGVVPASKSSASLPSRKKLEGMTPAQVAEWWAGLSAAERKRCIDSMPDVIGQLDGVDATSRSEANLAELDRYATDLAKFKTGDPGYAAAQLKLAAVRAIRKTLGDHPEKKDPPLQLLLLDLSGASPKAAISVGNLDTADHVTYNVPGMLTMVEKDMLGWTGASRNLYYRQRYIARRAGESTRVAVVSWIGYEAPQDFWGENGSDSARAGAKALAKALDGTLAARGWPAQSEHLSVVAFSYGSTVAGQALKEASAGTYVSVGSAGIPGDVAGRIPYRAPLNVPEGGISSGQAMADTTATAGRIASGREDPSAYGATPFSTDDARTPDGVWFQDIVNGCLGTS